MNIERNSLEHHSFPSSPIEGGTVKQGIFDPSVKKSTHPIYQFCLQIMQLIGRFFNSAHSFFEKFLSSRIHVISKEKLDEVCKKRGLDLINPEDIKAIQNYLQTPEAMKCIEDCKKTPEAPNLSEEIKKKTPEVLNLIEELKKNPKAVKLIEELEKTPEAPNLIKELEKTPEVLKFIGDFKSAKRNKAITIGEQNNIELLFKPNGKVYFKLRNFAGGEGKAAPAHLILVAFSSSIKQQKERVFYKVGPQEEKINAYLMEQEAENVSRLNVGKSKFYLGEGMHGILSLYFDKGSVNHLLEKKELSTSRRLEIASGMVTALNQLHNVNVVHRDLKPDNFLCGEDGIVKLSDFGSSSRTDTGISPLSRAPFTHLSPALCQQYVFENSLKIILSESTTPLPIEELKQKMNAYSKKKNLNLEDFIETQFKLPSFPKEDITLTSLPKDLFWANHVKPIDDIYASGNSLFQLFTSINQKELEERKLEKLGEDYGVGMPTPPEDVTDLEQVNEYREECVSFYHALYKAYSNPIHLGEEEWEMIETDYGQPVKEMLEKMLSSDPAKRPTLQEVNTVFVKKTP